MASPALRFLLLLPLFFVTLVAAHAPLLRLPYYWDEAGYYIPAAYDFLRTGTVIPFSTLTNAHPPGLSLYLAAFWKLFGFAPLGTRVSMCLAAATALVGVWELAFAAIRSAAAAAAVVLLAAIYPVCFAQASLAQADGLAAAATLWGLVFALRPQPAHAVRPRYLDPWLAAGCFTIAALTKEIAIGTPLALAAWELLLLWRVPPAVRDTHTSWTWIAALCFPVLPLAAWFGYHRTRTGYMFGNPGFLRYNATATLSPERFLLALAHRVMHLSLHLNLFVPVLIALGSLLLPRLPNRPRLGAGFRAKVWVVLAGNALLFSLLGGALLTRYLLPMYPLVLLLAVAAVYARFVLWFWFPVASAAAFLAALLLPPPYRVAPEDTLAYRDAVLLEQQAIAYVADRYPHSTVLSAWPVTDGLRKPELGYVQVPMRVVPVDNFSLPALQTLAGPDARGSNAPGYSTAIVFSTKYDPAGLPFRLGKWNERQEERYFDFHHDLDARAVAALLGGTVVWQQGRGGQWAAVLRFDHPQLARAATPGKPGRRSYNQREPGPVSRSPRS